MFRGCLGAAILACCATLGQESGSWEFDFSGTLDFGAKGYLRSPAHSLQKHHHYTLSFKPSLYFEHAEGDVITLTPYFLADGIGKEAIDADLREAYYLTYGYLGDTEWELRLGIDQVFWGTAESHNPVNIVNQTDFAADSGGDEKLGQPMIRGTLAGEWGTLSLLALPLHRPRIYPGLKGRLRTTWLSRPVPGEVFTSNRGEDILYEDSKKDRHIDVAARYSNSLGQLDFGISAFKGTSREPVLQPDTLPRKVCHTGMGPSLDDPGEGASVKTSEKMWQCYPQIEQVGLDLQLTAGDFIGKAEVISRSGFGIRGQDTSNHKAFVVGGEYAIYGIFDSDADLTLFAEWSQDERRERATTLWQNDLFLAARYALNDIGDTTVTAALVDDADSPTRSLTLLFEQRLNDSLSLEAEAYVFLQNPVPADTPAWQIRNDEYISMVLSYGF